MIILTDTNCVIQLFFLVGEAAIKDSDAPDLQIHPYVRQELDGLGRNKQHLKSAHSSMVKVFKIAQVDVDHNVLVEEKEYLEAQFDSIKAAGNVQLSQDPGNIDLTSLAFATINRCGFASLEHSLLALAKMVHDEDKVFTLSSIVKMFLEKNILTHKELADNLKNMPREEKLRKDDRGILDRILQEYYEREGVEP